jgi:hypothetical protein
MHIYSFLVAQQPHSGLGRLFVEVSRSHIVRLTHTTLGRTPRDEELACNRDLYLTTHNIHKTHIHFSSEIRTRNPNKRTVADPRLREHGYWNRLMRIGINMLLPQ